MSNDEWFLTGFARQVGLAPDDLRQPGTTVAPRPDRAGTGLVAVCHTVADGFGHTVLWTDPAIVEPLDLGRHERSVSTAIDDLHPRLVDFKGDILAKATMRVPIDGAHRWSCGCEILVNLEGESDTGRHSNLGVLDYRCRHGIGTQPRR